MSNNITNRLLKLKEDIEEAKASLNRLEGKQESLYNNLKSEFGCSSIEEGQEKLKALLEELTGKREDIQRQLDRLEEQYEW